MRSRVLTAVGGGGARGEGRGLTSEPGRGLPDLRGCVARHFGPLTSGSYLFKSKQDIVRNDVTRVKVSPLLEEEGRISNV